MAGHALIRPLEDTRVTVLRATKGIAVRRVRFISSGLYKLIATVLSVTEKTINVTNAGLSDWLGDKS